MRNFNENGRSMVEMLGVLAIIGVLSAGGLAGYSKAMFKHKLNNTMEQISMLVTNIRTHYGTQKNYATLTEAQLASLGVIPAVMGAAGSLKNPFKGDVKIAPAKARAADTVNKAFTVTYSGLPKEACIALATADFGSGAGSGFVGVAAFGTATTAGANNTSTANTADGVVYAGAGGDGRKEGEVYSMSGAIDVCTTETNTVSWKFY